MNKSQRLASLAAADSLTDREFARLVRRNMPFWRQSMRYRSVRRAKRFAFQMFWPVIITSSIATLVGAVYGLIQFFRFIT